MVKQFIATQGVLETTAGGTYVLRKDYDILNKAASELVRKLGTGEDISAEVTHLKELL